jgi:hypothetical protein
LKESSNKRVYNQTVKKSVLGRGLGALIEEPMCKPEAAVNGLL